jgi:NAD(P)-dependent dehydrogenase (short-subunit alcohol dehydrogenase family)
VNLAPEHIIFLSNYQVLYRQHYQLNMPALVYDTNTTASELVNDYKSIIQGKTILITGASPGSLGGYYAQNIAKASPACIILAGRNTTKLEQCTEEIQVASPNVKIRTLKLDLSSLQSTRDAAAEVVNNWDDIPVIDVLVNNAGIMAPEYRVSVDGFESQFATNHLGPFLFTNLIMKKILKSTSPRIVMVASDGHRLSPLRFDDYNFDVSEEP